MEKIKTLQIAFCFNPKDVLLLQKTLLNKERDEEIQSTSLFSLLDSKKSLVCLNYCIWKF